MIVLLCGLALAMTPAEAVRAATANDPALAGAESALLSATGARRSASWLRSNPGIELSADAGGARLGASVTQDISLSGAGVADARSGRYAVEASDLELELARLEEAGAVAAWLAAVDERVEAQSALAALTGEAGASAEGDPLSAVPTAGAASPRSDVAAAEARVESARAALARERAEAVPSVGVGAFLELEGERTLAGPALRVELPIWQQNAAGRGAAKGDLRVAEAEAASARARAEVEQRSAAERLVRLGGSGASLAPGVDASAEAALMAIGAGVERGQINPAHAALLRARVFAGQRGWYAARLAEAEGRIDAALAIEDAALLAP